MREIKFRQENTNDKNWHYWGFMDGGFITPLQGTGGGKSYQFTGLKDKNGKEVYEGDVVKRYAEVNPDYGFDVCIIQWNIARCYFELARGNEEAHYWGAIHSSSVNRYEVIGNIYENPELLKDVRP